VLEVSRRASSAAGKVRERAARAEEAPFVNL
jgi:hypothetical protein